MTREAKTRLAELASEASRILNASCASVEGISPQEAYHVYRRRVRGVMGYLFTNLLDPIWREYPDLEPQEMRTAGESPRELHRLPPAAVQVGQDTVHQVRALLAEAAAELANLPDDDRDYFLAGFAEVEREIESLTRLWESGRGRPTSGCS